jgi:hypothetical protein
MTDQENTAQALEAPTAEKSWWCFTSPDLQPHYLYGTDDEVDGFWEILNLGSETIDHTREEVTDAQVVDGLNAALRRDEAQRDFDDGEGPAILDAHAYRLRQARELINRARDANG